MIDITGNWRERDSFPDRLQTSEPDLQDNDRRTFRQRLSLPAGRFAVELEYDSIHDRRPGIYSDDTMFHVATPAFLPVNDRWFLYVQACPLPATKNYIDGRWDLWAFACDRRMPTRPGLADLFIPGLPDSAPAKETR